MEGCKWDSLVDMQLDISWRKIESKLDESKLHLLAFQQSWVTSLSPCKSFDRRSKAEGRLDKLVEMNGEPMVIQKETEEQKAKGYCFEYLDKSGSKQNVYFHESKKFSSINHELEHRHPGTNPESDEEEDEDSFLAKQRNYADKFSPITTIGCQYLASITFAAPDNKTDSKKRFDMFPMYPFQLAVRTDDQRRLLYYDCFEFKPDYWTPESGSLPSALAYRNASDALRMGGRSPVQHPPPWAYDSDGNLPSDYEEPSSDEDDGSPVDLGPVRNEKEKMKRKKEVKLITQANEFIHSRVYRVMVPLCDVKGALVHSPADQTDADDALSVLVLELAQPATSFAVRCVESNLAGDNKFSVINDWTPGKVASHATRHYICGRNTEISAVASHLNEISSDIFGCANENKENEGGKSSDSDSSNSLMNSKDLPVCAAPPVQAKKKARRTPAKGAKKGKKKKKKLSEDEVNKVLVEKCGVEDVERVSRCLKRAILLGHLKIGKKGTDTILRRKIERFKNRYFTNHEKCLSCSKKMQIRVRDVLYQPDNGGFDFNGAEATMKCINAECGRGMYVSGICRGRPHFSSGKFHNHCGSVHCGGFGVCLGDYRDCHCDDCGEHWFKGNSGFACSHCGGGGGKGRKGKSPAEKPLPDASVWNGWVTGYNSSSKRKSSSKNTTNAGPQMKKRKGAGIDYGSLNCSNGFALMECLLGDKLKLENFTNCHWQKNPHVVKRNNKRFYGQILTLDVIKQVVKKNKVKLRSELRVSRVHDEQRGKREIFDEEGLADVEKLEKLMKDKKATIQLLFPQRYVNGVWNVLEKMETYFGCLVDPAATIVPPHCRFWHHFDDSDSFHLQLEGTQEWNVYKYPVQRSSEDSCDEAFGEPILQVSLDAGDLLYLPRGVIYETKSSDTHSTHLSIAMYAGNTYGDFLKQMLRQTVAKALHHTTVDASLREGLPINYQSYLGTGRDIASYVESENIEPATNSNNADSKVLQFKEALKTKLDALVDHMDVNTASDAMCTRFFLNRLPPYGYSMSLPSALCGDAMPGLESKIKIRYSGHIRLVYDVYYDEDGEESDEDEDDSDDNGEQDGGEDGEPNIVRLFHSLRNDRHSHSDIDVREGYGCVLLDVAFAVAVSELIEKGSEQFTLVKDIAMEDDQAKLKLAQILFENDLVAMKP